MPEYVYALHDFLPENDDEVDFRAGERIEIVEKDDMYGDGWWQGRNLAGKVGLFPQSYTAPAPPTSNGTLPTILSTSLSTDAAESTVPKTTLQPLAEESDTESLTNQGIISPIPKQPPAAFLNGHDSDAESLTAPSTRDGGVMRATLTDVQKAIEQLGRNRVDNDGARSFSFASTRDGAETDDTDFDLSDVDGADNIDRQGEDWHKGARRKLAEKARKAVEEAQKLEDMMAGGGERRSTVPPIDVELSDESEDEGDLPDLDRNDFTTKSTNYPRMHPHIPEEDEDEGASAPADSAERDAKHQQEVSTASTVTPQPQAAASASTTSVGSQVVAAPKKDETDVPTATRETFPVFSPPMPTSSVTKPQQSEKALTTPQPQPTPISTVAEDHTPTPLPPIDQFKRNSAPTPGVPPLSTLPSPTTSTHASGFGFTTPFRNTPVSSVVYSVSTSATSAVPTLQTSIDQKEKKHPTEWSVDEVVEWLKGKGFDQDVCEKFVEQEITGDVLLELDVNLLKTEIGILAFGKRMRIANAITALRRPPSIASFEPQESHSPPSVIHQPVVHSRTQSQSYSHRSFPGTPLHGHSQSINSSLGSPVGISATTSNGPFSAPADNQVNGGSVATALATSGALAGLGIGTASDANGKATKGRPTHLTLSPSDGDLKQKLVIEDTVTITYDDQDRAHMSDGEVMSTSTSMRRRLFGRSHDSSLSVSNSSRHSKESVPPAPSLSGKEVEKESTASTLGSRHRTKRSMENKPADRLSIFGNTFSGSLGKGRKPPPSEDATDGKSVSMFSRLHSSSSRKTTSISHRPSTPSGSPKSSPIELSKERLRNASSSTAMTTATSATVVIESPRDSSEDRHAEKNHGERMTLRKRTVSSPVTAQHTNGVAEGTGEIKQGLSILEQVGQPEHTGWMRKKGIRYNSWKLRYFVLKGEHLYILRSSSKSETRLKGYINIHGYKVTVDENLDPGRYGFRIDHDHDKTHYFSSDEKGVIREWMKAIMKATIGRDYTKPVVSSCNIETIPLVVAQAMNPAPRPPSPTARDATQKALRRENPNQLSSRDARILMGLPSTADPKDERRGVNAFFSDEGAETGTVRSATTPKAAAPPRPSREMRRMGSIRSTATATVDEPLIEWANGHLPESLQVLDVTGPLFTGLGLLRIAESIKGKPASPPVPDSAFPAGPFDDKLDGLFKLFDFLLDNDVKMGSVSINDVRQGKRDKILQMLRALKAWEDKRRAIALSMGSTAQAGGSFMVPAGLPYGSY